MHTTYLSRNKVFCATCALHARIMHVSCSCSCGMLIIRIPFTYQAHTMYTYCRHPINIVGDIQWTPKQALHAHATYALYMYHIQIMYIPHTYHVHAIYKTHSVYIPIDIRYIPHMYCVQNTYILYTFCIRILRTQHKQSRTYTHSQAHALTRCTHIRHTHIIHTPDTYLVVPLYDILNRLILLSAYKFSQAPRYSPNHTVY